MADIQSTLKGISDSFWSAVGKTTSLLASFAFLIFSVGVFYGFYVSMNPQLYWTLWVPPLIGAFSFYYPSFAFFSFIIFMFFVFAVFI